MCEKLHIYLVPLPVFPAGVVVVVDVPAGVPLAGVEERFFNLAT
jgi:hypothetical protein